jgi:hypothetical protein
MKTSITLILLAINPFLYAQENFHHISEEDLSNYDYSYNALGIEKCQPEEGVTAVFLEIPTIDPSSSDQDKLEALKNLDLVIASLKVYAECPEITTFYFKVGEALFLTESDGIKLYSKKYFKKGHALNAARFWERYKTQLNNMLPGRTFYYADWGW